MSRRRKNTTEYEESREMSGGKNKGLALLFIIIIVLAGVGAAATYWMMSQPSGGYISTGDDEENSTPNTESGSSENPTTVINAQLSVKYTPLTSVSKKVIGELFVETTCPACPKAENDLKSIESQRDDFYLVSLVVDKNQDALSRFVNTYKLRYTPTTVFDGGYREEVGAVRIDNYTRDINECKNSPATPVEISGNVVSKSGSRATVSVNVVVGDKNFNGNVKAFVIDKNSNWKNTAHERIPNAFLGYLPNDDISLSNGNIDKTGQWKMDGTKSFSELAVVIAIYDSNGYALQAYRIDL
jgi:hypothetical protein